MMPEKGVWIYLRCTNVHLNILCPKIILNNFKCLYDAPEISLNFQTELLYDAQQSIQTFQIKL